MPAASRDDSRSLVWPANCGSCILSDSTKERRSHTSSGASLTPRGSRLRISQNSRMRIGEAGAQAVHVRAALGGRNQVDVAFLHQLAFRQPRERDIEAVGLALQCGERTVRRESLQRHRARRAGNRAGRPRNTTRSTSPLASSVSLHGEARAQHRLGAQQVAAVSDSENLRRVEILRVGPEAQRGAGLLLRHRADDFEIARRGRRSRSSCGIPGRRGGW